jgi:hypothetical protein
VGLNVGYQQLRSTRLPNADVFWNRILGRRCDTPRNDELSIMNSEHMLARGSPRVINLGSGELMEMPIRMAGEAAQAVLLSVLLFGVYWLAAGLVGFALLKHYRQQQHAWLVFVGTAALFTLVAWGSVKVIRGTDVAIRHITFLDHIAEPKTEGRTSENQVQKAVSWLSVFMPSYGRQRISLEALDDQPNMLVSWHPPHKARIERFPNVDRYRVDIARHPSDYAVPSRATAKQFYANSLGAVSADWGGMLSADPNDPIQVDPKQPDRLTGTISHSLPGPLRNVRVIWVQDNRPTQRRYALAADGSNNEEPWVRPLESGDMLNTGRFWKLDLPLDPGRAYSLSEILKSSGPAFLDSNIDLTYVKPFKDRTDVFAPPSVSTYQGAFRDMLSLFQGLTPPVYVETDPRNPKTTDNLLVRREIGRELDLSGWLNRPCLIIIGELDDSPAPIPLQVNGEMAASRGLTVIRWVYPLDFVADSVVTPKPAIPKPDPSSPDADQSASPPKPAQKPAASPGSGSKPTFQSTPPRKPKQ